MSRSRCRRVRPILNDPAFRCWRCSHPSRVRSRCGRSPARRSRWCSRSSGRWWPSRRCSTRDARGAPNVGEPVPSVPGCSMNCVPRSPCATRPSVGPHGGGRRHPATLIECSTPPAWQPGPLPAIVVGSGAGRSSVRVDGTPADADERRLLAHAASLERAPVLADPYGGIGFVGVLPLARAAARAALVQCAHHGVPGGLALELPRSTALAVGRSAAPHRSGSRAAASARPCRRLGLSGRRHRCTEGGRFRVARADRASAAMIAVAADAAALPPGLQTVVRIDAPDSALVRRHDGAAPVPVVPALTGVADALAWAAAATRVAERAGVAAAWPAFPAACCSAT